MGTATIIDSGINRKLDEYGLAIINGQVEMVDFQQAERCYVHHSSMPVALVGFASVSKVFARGRFPKTTFFQLIQKRPSMDEIEARTLAAVCGVALPERYWQDKQAFGHKLWDIIERYELDPFFQRLGKRYGSGGDHYLMRPRGFEWETPGERELPKVLDQWRKDYRTRSEVHQLMIATIMQLYMSRDEKYWMVRVNKGGLAADAISTLHAAGVLDDWAGLYCRYTDW